MHLQPPQSAKGPFPRALIDLVKLTHTVLFDFGKGKQVSSLNTSDHFQEQGTLQIQDPN